jgi:hypothetical protein
MNTLKLIIIGLLIVGTASLSSCKKEGCTDSDGVNYIADAKKDDGSCQYEGSVVFWYGKDVAIGLQNDGATSLIYYVNGDVIGSSAVSIYWANQPSCGQNSSITVTRDLWNVKSLAYNFSIKDQRGKEYWSRVLNITANKCETIRLLW